MENLQDTKRMLLERIPNEGMGPVIKTLKTLVTTTSSKYTLLLQLEAELKEINTKNIDGLLSTNDHTLANNKLRRRLFNFIESIKETDLESNTQSAVGDKGRNHKDLITPESIITGKSLSKNKILFSILGVIAITITVIALLVVREFKHGKQISSCDGLSSIIDKRIKLDVTD